MSKMNRELVGKNIRALRKANGETLDQLGRVIGVEYNTVSQYETGKRAIPLDSLSLIAQHYGVSAEVIMTQDMSCTEYMDLEQLFKLFVDNIERLLPIFKPKESSQSEELSCALELHRKAYEGIKTISAEFIEDIYNGIEAYSHIYENIKDDSNVVANYAELLILLLSVLKIMVYSDQFDQVEAGIIHPDDKEFRVLIEDEEYKYHKKNLREAVIRLRELKCKDLAYYYLALESILLVRDNILGREHGTLLGHEMMIEFATIKNKYAQRFVKILIDGVKDSIPQNFTN
ncbi:MAG: helix-turn-helix domain-containing protein [Clostridiales bacterium]|nr:helix-turn-helix domain-containing protein [Clostridiales bacterium]